LSPLKIFNNSIPSTLSPRNRKGNIKGIHRVRFLTQLEIARGIQSKTARMIPNMCELLVMYVNDEMDYQLH
jgi:hypothetical protein